MSASLVGSEMCIRDRNLAHDWARGRVPNRAVPCPPCFHVPGRPWRFLEPKGIRRPRRAHMTRRDSAQDVTRN
eukprot:2417732-Alexandrium_andersonii.AAC.1